MSWVGESESPHETGYLDLICGSKSWIWTLSQLLQRQKDLRSKTLIWEHLFNFDPLGSEWCCVGASISLHHTKSSRIKNLRTSSFLQIGFSQTCFLSRVLSLKRHWKPKTPGSAAHWLPAAVCVHVCARVCMCCYGESPLFLQRGLSPQSSNIPVTSNQSAFFALSSNQITAMSIQSE